MALPPTPLPTRPVTPRSDSEDELWQMMSGYMGVRTRFFDEFFDAAGRAGVRQAVILAAGLDARAQRLDWAPGQFLKSREGHLVCAAHGASFALSDGTCVAGPCRGDTLRAVAVQVRDGEVYLA